MSQNYKETLNLPKTDFPMKANLATREPEMLKKRQAAGLYEQIQAARAGAELFVLHDGPPFANGDVHMGTALNKIHKHQLPILSPVDNHGRYTDEAGLHRIFDALCRLLAPITVFTAEEAWNCLGASESVHLQLFPEQNAEFRNPTAQGQVEQLLSLRAVIGQAVERARQEKLIGNALEAAVVLCCDQEAISSIPNEELEEFFILSDLKIESGKEPAVSISKTAYAKCARCWRHRSTVGASAEHPELCDRCAAVGTAGQRS